jgi:hypothetical protein
MTDKARGAWIYGVGMFILCAGCAGIAAVGTFIATGQPAPVSFLGVGTLFCVIHGVPIAVFVGSIIYPHEKRKERQR